ncbi:MAG: response regulator [Xenococcaceae cyanobacterium]
MTMSQSDRTVLIVNGSLLERTTYRCYLQEETSFAYTIWEAESTEEGLQLCTQKIPDSIVLDYLLPDRDGLEFLLELKTCIGENCPPVIMLNDRGNEAIAIRALKAGVEDYLIKNEITPECLRCVTRTAIENFRLRQKLRESEERYRAIVEDQTELICRFSLDYTLTFVNSAYSRYFSSTPNRLIGQNFLNLIPESYHSTVHQQIAEFVKLSEQNARAKGTATPENAVMTHEHPVLKPNGDLGWQQWTNRAIFDDNGQLIEFQAVGRDISDRKQNEATIQQQLAQIEAIYTTAPIGLCFLDRERRFVQMNERLAEINGLPLSEHIGRTIQEILPELAEIQEPIFEQVLQTGNPILNVEVRGTTPAQPKVERYWLANYYPLKTVDGQLLGINITVQEITDRKIAENQLQESEQRLQLGVQVADLALARFDYTSNTVKLSSKAAVLYGLGTDELVVSRDRIHATFHPEEREIMERIIQQVLDPTGDGWFDREHRVVWHNGEVRWLYVRKRVFFDRSGDSPRPSYAILAAIDITKRKQAEQERDRLLADAQAARAAAEEANRSKDEFVAVVAHELRSPINSVAGWAQLLRMQKIDAATTDRALEAIARGTQTQVQLIEDLLDISRMACGTLRLTIAPVNLVTVMEAALSLMRPMVDAKQIHLETRFVAIAQVSGDRNRLQQIVVNLLTNAIKFTPEFGQITVTLEQVGEQARIQVSDTGKGISPEFLPNIFERFQQAQKNAGSKDGLGLGLAIVKNLVEMHNGKITAESPGVGQGTTFTVWLPLHEVEPAVNTETVAIGSASARIAIAPDAPSLTGIRILAVDDEADSLELLRFILEEAGAEVRTASSGSVALDILPQFNPSLIVSDIAMPDLNGYQLLQQIRTLYPDRQIPAIALTAYTSSSDREYSMRIGFERCFSKPIEPEALVQYIIGSIGKRFDLLT